MFCFPGTFPYSAQKTPSNRPLAPSLSSEHRDSEFRISIYLYLYAWLLLLFERGGSTMISRRFLVAKQRTGRAQLSRPPAAFSSPRAAALRLGASPEPGGRAAGPAGRGTTEAAVPERCRESWVTEVRCWRRENGSSLPFVSRGFGSVSPRKMRSLPVTR